MTVNCNITEEVLARL